MPAADNVALSVWSHHEHHCRPLRVSAQVERSMGGGSAGPCFAEVRMGGEWSCAAGLIRWGWVSKMCAVHAPDSQGMADTGGALCATSATWEIVRLERTVEGAVAAPGCLERLSEAMLQCYWRLAAD